MTGHVNSKERLLEGGVFSDTEDLHDDRQQNMN